MSYRMSGDEANEPTNKYTNLFKQSYYLKTKKTKILCFIIITKEKH